MQWPYLAAPTIPSFREGVISMLTAAERVTISERIAAVIPRRANSFSKQHGPDTQRRTGIAQPPVEGAEGSTVISADSQM